MSDLTLSGQFDEIVSLIRTSQYRVLSSANRELIELYWAVGNYISSKMSVSEWGDKTVERLSDYIKEKEPTIKGFNKRNLYRMKKFYEIYKDCDFVSSLRSQISWTNHRIIISRCKSMEDKEFYMNLSSKEGYTSRELERQINSGVFERVLLYNKKNNSNQNKYNKDLREKFKPEYLGQLEFYLEVLDRNIRKSHENPSIGVLLCRDKDDEVVEYALSRSLSPTIVSEYETKLIPKELLRKKLNEFYNTLEVNIEKD